MLDKKRACKGLCEKFKAGRPSGGGRYEAGQARCQICEIWLHRSGAHLHDGSPARGDKAAWYCNCCQYRLRRIPKKTTHKPRPRRDGDTSMDLSYFNKYRAFMLRNLGQAIAQKTIGGKTLPLDDLLPSQTRVSDIESEFESSISEILDLAYSDLPNKVSLVVEFEMLKHMLGKVPAKSETHVASKFSVAQYEKEFESWEHMLERLGYDPWYRNENLRVAMQPDRSKEHPGSYTRHDLDHMKQHIRSRLKSEPPLLDLFDRVDSQIDTMDAKMLERTARNIHV